MTTGEKFAAYGIVGGAVVVLAWPLVKAALKTINFGANLVSGVTDRTQAVIDFFAGSCGIGQGDCQNPAAEWRAMQKRFSACAARAVSARHDEVTGSGNPCLPDTDHTDVGLNFVYDINGSPNVPVALPDSNPNLRSDGSIGWGPRFQYQLLVWRAAVTKLGVTDLYAGLLSPQCGTNGKFINWLGHGGTGQWSDDSFISSPCSSVYWNGGMTPFPWEAKINAWLRQKRFI
jgi:hypothetical protein